MPEIAPSWGVQNEATETAQKIRRGTGLHKIVMKEKGKDKEAMASTI